MPKRSSSVSFPARPTEFGSKFGSIGHGMFGRLAPGVGTWRCGTLGIPSLPPPPKIGPPCHPHARGSRPRAQRRRDVAQLILGDHRRLTTTSFRPALTSRTSRRYQRCRANQANSCPQCPLTSSDRIAVVLSEQVKGKQLFGRVKRS